MENSEKQPERVVKKRKFNEFSEQFNPLDPSKRVLSDKCESSKMTSEG